MHQPIGVTRFAGKARTMVQHNACPKRDLLPRQLVEHVAHAQTQFDNAGGGSQRNQDLGVAYRSAALREVSTPIRASAFTGVRSTRLRRWWVDREVG